MKINYETLIIFFIFFIIIGWKICFLIQTKIDLKKYKKENDKGRKYNESGGRIEAIKGPEPRVK